MEEFIVSAEHNIAYYPKHKVGVMMQADAAPKGVKTTTGTITGETSTEGIKVANWGDDNDFPGMIKKILAKDAEMLKLIDWCVRASIGGGLVPLNEIDIKEDGTPVYAAIKDRDILDFYRSRLMKRFLLEGFIDLFTFFNVFPEMITSNDRKGIISISTNEAMHCRWAKMGSDGLLKNVIHNRNFPVVKLEDKSQTTIIPALDIYDFDLVNTVRNDKSLKKFIYPVSYPTIGQTYYQVAHWDGLRVSGWLDIAAKIPAFKTALLKNQMTIKYLIRIPNTYWPSKYKNWNDLDQGQMTTKKQETLDAINKSLTDVENTGKSMLNEVGFDPVTKEKLPGWEIEVIDYKTKAGAFLEDSQEASSHKARALGLDNSLVGSIITGKGMSAGSGSDKRLAYNIWMALISPYRDIILDLLNFAAEFNGYKDRYPGFTLKFMDTVMQTLDVAHSTAKKGATEE